MIDPIRLERGILIRYIYRLHEADTKNRVTDHRGFKFNDLRGCMEGSALQELMDGVAKALQRLELQEAIAMDADASSSTPIEAHA